MLPGRRLKQLRILLLSDPGKARQGKARPLIVPLTKAQGHHRRMRADADTY
jgi:hypothetical protein